MTLVVGLTGGIGSGKTLASDHFALLGVPVIDTDVIARQIVQPDQPALASLVKIFGKKILQTDGYLDRDVLRQLAFSNDSNKAQLDAITHPAIRIETTNQIADVDYRYCIVVVPLLRPNAGFDQFMHRILVVTADRETRIMRVIKRSGLSRKHVEAIMQTQLSDEQRMEFADDLIENNTSIENVHTKVEELHHIYLEAGGQLK